MTLPWSKNVFIVPAQSSCVYILKNIPLRSDYLIANKYEDHICWHFTGATQLVHTPAAADGISLHLFPVHKEHYVSNNHVTN